MQSLVQTTYFAEDVVHGSAAAVAVDDAGVDASVVAAVTA